ncbi:MAG: AMP-binding protein, partial [Burkholderiales bacterium]
MKRPAVIRKGASGMKAAPNLADYAAARASFSWEAARRELAGLPGGGLNIAYEAVDRHARGALREHIALRFLPAAGEQRDVSYAELARLTSRFANALRRLGVGKGDRLFVLAGRVPELYSAVLGSLKGGCVVSPLFSAFGPEPIATRIRLGEGKVLVTTELLYRRKVEMIRAELPTLEHVLLIGEGGAATNVPATLDLGRLMAEAADEFETVSTTADDVALLHFTSGTTGRPKGAVHVHGAVITHYATGKYALDLHPDDIFWCTADPGWVTGTSYGIIAPLVHGVTSIVDEAEFDAERWYRILAEQRV